MTRLLATGVMVFALAALPAAPVPAETRKPAAFPAGQYVLTGADEPAKGDDVYEFPKTFRLKRGQYVLSGGSKPSDLVVIDDDLEVDQGGKKLVIDDDHAASASPKSTYKGQPIVLVLDPAKKIRIVGVDHCVVEAIVGALWLHRWDGARKKLTDGKQERSAQNLPNTFFDESYILTAGFELPENLSTDAPLDTPEKPATLLPRFRPPAPPAAPGSATPPR
jgi:hypothetical protein